MIYLLFSIICSTIILSLFKVYERFEIDTFQAIIYNYIVCVIVGSLSMGEIPISNGFWQLSWFPFATILGLIFIIGFYISALTVQYFGITIATVMQKMSLILTVIFVISYFKETVNISKIVGIIAAIAAVILTSNKHNPTNKLKDALSKNKWFIILPFATLLMAGFIEVNLQYVQVRLLSPDTGQMQFTTFLFGVAAFLGTIILAYNLLTQKMSFKIKHLAGGIALGIPNFGSIYFLMMALAQGWEGSVVFPIINVGVIVLSSLVGVLYFKEQLDKYRLIGVILALIAIVFIAIS